MGLLFVLKEMQFTKPYAMENETSFICAVQLKMVEFHVELVDKQWQNIVHQKCRLNQLTKREPYLEPPQSRL